MSSPPPPRSVVPPRHAPCFLSFACACPIYANDPCPGFPSRFFQPLSDGFAARPPGRPEPRHPGTPAGTRDRPDHSDTRLCPAIAATLRGSRPAHAGRAPLHHERPDAEKRRSVGLLLI